MKTRLLAFVAFSMLLFPFTSYSLSASIESGGMWFVVSSSAPIVNMLINRTKAELRLQSNDATRVFPVIDLDTKDIIGAAQVAGSPSILMKTSAVGMSIKSADGLSVLWFKLLDRDGRATSFEGRAGVTALVSYPQWGCGFPVICGNCPESPVIHSDGGGAWGKAVPFVSDGMRLNAMAILDGEQKFLAATVAVHILQSSAGDKKIFLLIPSCDPSRFPKQSLALLNGMAFPSMVAVPVKSPVAEAGVRVLVPDRDAGDGTKFTKAVPDYRIEIGELPFGKPVNSVNTDFRVQEGSNKPSEAKSVGADPSRFYEADHYQWWHDETDRYEY